MRIRFSVAAAALALCVTAPSVAFAAAADCPNGGTVRFGVEPYENGAKLLPVYNDLMALLSQKLDCKVELFVATGYTAEIEAMRSGKLEVAEFGPLGYVFANKVAKAQIVATFADKAGKPSTYTAGIYTYPGSGVNTLADLKDKSFAYSDAASTSGHLFPATALSHAGIDPDKGIKAVYAGSHTASFEALKNHKVQAGEVNSSRIELATKSGDWKDGLFVKLWVSDPIPGDPIAVRGDLPDAFKARFTKVVLSLNLSELPKASQDFLKSAQADGTGFVALNDTSFDVIRDMVSVMHVNLDDLDKL